MRWSFTGLLPACQLTVWAARRALVLAVVCTWLGAGCVSGPPPIPISEDRAHGIWMQFDPESGPGYDHPAILSPDQLTQVLRGLWVVQRDVVGGFDLLSSSKGAPVFREEEAQSLAVGISRGLAKASPKDLVTFYSVAGGTEEHPLITSGGLFVRGRHLHVLLANGRSSAYGVQYENTYRLDPRDSPLIPVAPRKFKAGFSPPEAWIKNDQLRGTPEFRGYSDESKLVVVDLAKLPPPAPKPAIPGQPSPK